MAQMKKKNKTPEKELSEMEIANLSDAEVKTLVIRMLKRIIVYGSNRKEEMMVKLSKMKNLQGSNHERKEAGIQINNLEHKEKINIQPKQKNKTRIKKKNKDSIRRLWDNFEHTNNQIIRVPEGEEEEQENENLFEK